MADLIQKLTMLRVTSLWEIEAEITPITRVLRSILWDNSSNRL